jgi:hypothetical protein
MMLCLVSTIWSLGSGFFSSPFFFTSVSWSGIVVPLELDRRLCLANIPVDVVPALAEWFQLLKPDLLEQGQFVFQIKIGIVRYLDHLQNFKDEFICAIFIS